MARLPDRWKNAFTYEGWILDVSEPEDRDGLLGYHLRVGFSEDEQIRVMAFRRKPTKNLVKGVAVRVTGNFRFIPDSTGLVRLKLDASKIEPIEPPD
ncbi:MAG: hypothetical protein QNJ98_19300 [Planctomycetota bacterium]|nr:hypothetical protein [Planctomycetota bacterium]